MLLDYQRQLLEALKTNPDKKIYVFWPRRYGKTWFIENYPEYKDRIIFS